MADGKMTPPKDKLPEVQKPKDAKQSPGNHQVDRLAAKAGQGKSATNDSGTTKAKDAQAEKKDSTEGKDKKGNDEKGGRGKEGKKITSSDIDRLASTKIDTGKANSKGEQGGNTAAADNAKRLKKEKQIRDAINADADAVLHGGKLTMSGVSGYGGSKSTADNPATIAVADKAAPGDEGKKTDQKKKNETGEQPPAGEFKNGGADKSKPVKDDDDPKFGRQSEPAKDNPAVSPDKESQIDSSKQPEAKIEPEKKTDETEKKKEAGNDKKNGIDKLSLDPEAHNKGSVEEAFKQRDRWRNEDGTAIHEKNNEGVLAEYFKNSGKSGEASEKAAKGGKEAWSGATISTIEVNSPGGGYFPKSAIHAEYTNAAKRNAETGAKGEKPGAANPYWAFDAATAKPEVGDIIVRQRKGGENETFGNLNSKSKLHGEKVVEVGKDYVKVISGNASHHSLPGGKNEGNTISDPQIRKLDAEGHLSPVGADKFKYVAVIKFVDLNEKKKKAQKE